MKVLIACEESQTVCKAFRANGHEAYSCDILDCSGGYPEWHIKGDALEQLDKDWDLVIAHPPCTYLTVTGNRWFNIEKYGDKARQRHKDRKEAINFFMAFTKLQCPYAIENPVGIMSTNWRKPDQKVHPYHFGDPFEKTTCWWLNDLPLLKYTNVVKPPPRQQIKGGKSMPEWYSNAPKKDRSRIRSKTFQGMAQAMADQWGGAELNKK